MNLGKSYILFFAYLINSISDWNYKDVDLWEKEYPTCGGTQQSPIDLDKVERGPDSDERIQFRRYNISPKKMTMKNNGHTVEIKPEWDGSPGQKPKVIKDGAEYEVMQLHFHWGPSDDSGSEHIFDSCITPLELHIVHWNPDFGDFDPEQGDGILVIGVLFILKGEYGASFLTEVVSMIPNIVEPNSEPVEIEPFTMASIISEVMAQYFLTYTGSLTTPPCSEGVSWVILSEPSTVDNQQMEVFRTIKFSHGDDHNNRPIQSPNLRKITTISAF